MAGNATFSYDSTGRLSQIQDVIGIQSSFGYNSTGDFLNTLTTPYGTSTFTVTDNGTVRRLTATNAVGDTEVLESNYNASNAVADHEAIVPSGMNAENQYLQFRNSFLGTASNGRKVRTTTRRHISITGCTT